MALEVCRYKKRLAGVGMEWVDTSFLTRAVCAGRLFRQEVKLWFADG